MSDRCSIDNAFSHITKQYRGGILKIEEAIKLLNVNSFDNKLTELYVDSNRIPQEKDGI